MTDLRLAQAEGVLRALAMCGIKVTLDGDRLNLKAPRGALSAEDREVLADYKAEMVELLKPSDPPPPPMTWREVLAQSSVALRERWGRRANELEISGLDWRTAEEQAFQEVLPEQNSMAA